MQFTFTRSLVLVCVLASPFTGWARPAPAQALNPPAQNQQKQQKPEEQKKQQKEQQQEASLKEDANTFTRMTFGLEQAGASSASTKTNFLADFFILGPLTAPKDSEYDVSPRAGIFGNFRFSSVPEQVKSSVKEFSGSFATSGFNNRKVNDLVQGFSALVGIEARLFRTGSFRSSTTDPTAGRLSFSWVLSGGLITPLTPRDSLEVFQISDEARERFPELKDAKDKEYVAFVTPDRNRFFRQYYTGMRIRTYVTCTSAGAANGTCDRDGQLLSFPNTIDFLVGKNEQVSGGSLNDWVGRMEAFYSLPGIPVYLFGNVLMHFDKAKDGTPLLLKAPSEVVPVPGPKVMVISLPFENRDYWKLGIAVNLSTVVKGLGKPASSENKTEPQSGGEKKEEQQQEETEKGEQKK